MFYISEITHTAPITYHSKAQKKAYSAWKDLDISFDRVDTDAAIEMESCLAIDQDTINEEYFGCSDITAFSFIKRKTADLLQVILPGVHRVYKVIILPYEKEN